MDIVLLGGIVHPITSEKIEDGYIIIRNGKIAEIGEGKPSDETVSGMEIHNFHGKHILPGLIDAHTHLGILEEKIGEIGKDNNETSDPIAPHLRALDAVNPNDVGFMDALR